MLPFAMVTPPTKSLTAGQTISVENRAHSAIEEMRESIETACFLI
jgi:hypothetical protein